MTIHQKFTGDPSQLLKAYQDLSAANTRLEQQVGKLAHAMRNSGEQAKKTQANLSGMVNRGVGDIRNYITQWASVTAAIAAVGAGLDDLDNRRNKVATTGVSVGSSQGDVIRNLTGVSASDKRAYLQESQKIFSETQFPDLNEFNRASASGLSASSGDRTGTLNALRAAAQLTRDKPQDLAEIVGAALDVQKASGLKDAERNLGFMLQTGGQARLVDMGSQARNIPSALISASNTVTGDKAQATREAAALFAAIGSQAGDQRGESTRTAIQSFTVQLRDFFTEGEEKTVNGRKFKTKPPTDPGTIEGRIAALQGNEKLRNKFLDKASFERQFQVPVEQLLKGGATNTQFRTSLKQINFDKTEFAEQTRDLKTLTASTSLATADAASKGRTQLAEVNSSHDGRIGQSHKIMQDTLAQTRGSGMLPFELNFIGDQFAYGAKQINDQISGTNPIASAITQLEVRQREILATRDPLIGGSLTGVAWGVKRSEQQLTKDERTSLRYVDDQIAILRQLLEEDKAAALATETQTAVLREVRDALKDRLPAAAVPAAARNERGGQREQ